MNRRNTTVSGQPRPGRAERGAAFWLVLTLALSGGRAARADFELPISHPVPKIISVPEDFPGEVLARFARVRHLVLDIRTRGGNMLRDRTISLLNERFSDTWKQISLHGPINRTHVRQLRRIQALMVHYTFDGGFDRKQVRDVLNMLNELGPIRKTVQLPSGFTAGELHSLRTLKFYVPSFELGAVDFNPEQVAAIGESGKRIKRFRLPAHPTAEQVTRLMPFAPLILRIPTRHNRLDEHFVRFIAKLQDMEPVLVVDGRLTVEDVRPWCQLERFTIELVLDSPSDITPGLTEVLNRINPP